MSTSLRFRLRQLLTALWWAVRVEWSIRRATLPGLCRLVGVEHRPEGSDVPAPPTDGATLSRWDAETLRIVSTIYRWWPLGTGPCLRATLVAGRLLRYRSPVVRIGVDKRGEAIVAHAWLEIDGMALDAEHGSYALLRSS